MKGAWLLPTRRRISTLKRFLQAAKETGVRTPGKILVQRDEQKEFVSEYATLDLPEGWTVCVTDADGMGDKFREIWPLVKDMDWVGWLVDDLVPMTPGWDKTMISGINGQNIISCNDGARAPFRMCAPVISGDLLRAVGYIYAEGFWHTYMDDAWERLGRATDTWWVCMDVLLKHFDAFQDSGIADETHFKSYGQGDRDKAAFYAWRKNEMDGAVRRIMDLKAQQREPQRKVANA